MSEPVVLQGAPVLCGGGARAAAALLQGGAEVANDSMALPSAAFDEVAAALLLGDTTVEDWEEDELDDKEDEPCPPANYGSRTTDLERSLNGSLSVTRGGRGGGVLSLSLSKNDTLSSSFLVSPSALRARSESGLTWVRGEIIGRGSLGIVFKALNQETGEMFAAKEVLINPSSAEDRQYREQLENEIRILTDLKHPRIVSYLGHDSIEEGLYIYLEFMPGGSLAQVLAQFGHFDESLIAVYTRALLEGLWYLHSRSPPVVHRDIKGANVLVGLEGQVKLADFGCSKRSGDTMSRTMKGSIPWMAPEAIHGTGYGRSADVWSMGCVCLEMASEARTPWGQKFDNPVVAMFKIAKSEATPPIPDALSENARDFIQLCVRREATERPTADELLKHAFVADLLLDDE